MRAALLAFVVALVATTIGTRTADGALPSSRQQPVAGGFAFTSFEGLHTVRPDGSDLRTLTVKRGFAAYPAFSPDGTRLLYSFYDGIGGGLWTSRPDGSEAREVVTATARRGRARRRCNTMNGVSEGAWSPAGRRIAFVGSYEVGRDPNPRSRSSICTVAADGSRLRDLRVSGADPDWIAGTNRIAFIRRSDWYFPDEIVTMNDRGRDVRVVLSGASARGIRDELDVSPNGRMLAFADQDYDARQTGIGIIDLLTLKTWLIPVAVTGEVNALAWSPDSARIAFFAEKLKPGTTFPDGPTTLNIIRPDGSEMEQLFALPADPFSGPGSFMRATSLAWQPVQAGG